MTRKVLQKCTHEFWCVLVGVISQWPGSDWWSVLIPTSSSGSSMMMMMVVMVVVVMIMIKMMIFTTLTSWVLISRVNESWHHDIECHIECISSETIKYMWRILWLIFIISFACMLHVYCKWVWWVHANLMTGYIINVIKVCWALSPLIYCGLHCKWDHNVLCTYI